MIAKPRLAAIRNLCIDTERYGLCLFLVSCIILKDFN